MKEEIFKRLDVIAAKLGVASEHLWRILLTQVKVDIWQDVLVAFITVGLGAIFESQIKFCWEEEAGLGIFVGFCAVGLLLIALFNVASIIGYAVNPEYYALRKAFELIKEVK